MPKAGTDVSAIMPIECAPPANLPFRACFALHCAVVYDTLRQK